jgi:arylsulfatase A-like enzyme
MTFGSLDGHQHVNGTDARYVELVRHADRVIGRYREASRRLGLERDRLYALVSDHGVADARVNVDLRAALRECCGLRAERDRATRIFTSSLDVPLSGYDGADAVIAINGNMLNFVYLRDPVAAPEAAWSRPLGRAQLAAYGPRRVDVVEGLRRARGVEMVIVRGEAGEVEVYGREGRGRVTTSASGLAYGAEGLDPLGYAALGLADGRARSPAQWLQATHAAPFPDAPGRIAALMAGDAAGDLVVTALPGHDFGLDYEALVGNYRGGHGGLRADQLRVPYVLAGPGVRAGTRIEAARAEDVGATLLDLLGLPPEPGGAGRVLREGLTAR